MKLKIFALLNAVTFMAFFGLNQDNPKTDLEEVKLSGAVKSIKLEKYVLDDTGEHSLEEVYHEVYNEDGYLLSSKVFAIVTKYYYEMGLCIADSTFDTMGVPGENCVSFNHYTYKNRKLLWKVQSNDKVQSRLEYKYYDDGKLSHEYSTTGCMTNYICKYIYKGDKLYQKITFTGEEVEVCTTEYKYEGDNLVVLENRVVDSDKDLIESIERLEYTYNEHGHQTKQTVYYTADDYTVKDDYYVSYQKYDNQNNWIERKLDAGFDYNVVEKRTIEYY